MLLREVISKPVPKKLHSKNDFDRVENIENKKPEIVVSGCDDKRDSVDKSQLNGNLYTPIIAMSPNFRKEIGHIMSEETIERFIKIPRELVEDPNWKGMRLKYQKLFLIILEECAFRPRVYKHNGNSIEVSPGQLCVSFRRLADIFNKDVKWKEERIDAPLVQRAVSVFFKFGFSIHESIHGIMRLTITQRELYEHFKKLNDTPTDTQPIQNRYTNEERKEGKEQKGTYIDVGSTLSNENKKNKNSIPYQPQTFSTEIDVPKICEDQIKEDFFLVEEFVKSNQIPLNSQELERWIRKYGAHTVLANLELMTKQKKTIPKPGGWMESALKEDWAKMKKNIPINKKFAEEFKQEKKWNNLKILQKYCTIEGTGYDIQLNFDPETFRAILESKFENFHRAHDGEMNY